jgi:hypothetical protein
MSPAGASLLGRSRAMTLDVRTNMNSYLSDSFATDATSILRSTNSSIVDRLSLAHMVPSVYSYDPHNPYSQAFSRLDSPRLFLYAFFMLSMLDQTIHSRFSKYHLEFEKQNSIPKPCGILGSYWSIYHPSYILAAATLWPNESDIDFAILSNQFWQRELTARIDKFAARVTAQDARLNQNNITSAIAEEITQESHYTVGSLSPFSKKEADHKQGSGFILSFLENK